MNEQALGSQIACYSCVIIPDIRRSLARCCASVRSIVACGAGSVQLIINYWRNVWRSIYIYVLFYWAKSFEYSSIHLEFVEIYQMLVSTQDIVAMAEWAGRQGILRWCFVVWGFDPRRATAEEATGSLWQRLRKGTVRIVQSSQKKIPVWQFFLAFDKLFSSLFDSSFFAAMAAHSKLTSIYLIANRMRALLGNWRRNLCHHTISDDNAEIRHPYMYTKIGVNQARCNSNDKKN